MTDSINIKGISQGILASITTEDVDLSVALIDLIDQQAAFFKGAQLVLDVKEMSISESTLSELINILQARDVRLVGLLSTKESTRATAVKYDLATILADIPAPVVASASDDDDDFYELEGYDSEEYGTGGVLIKRTLRSGRTVRSAGHVVVIGDVNSGAEIVAVGDVVVWGKLRGTVHAGAQGDENAVVCALDLKPMQLRIASLITIPPQDKRRRAPQPEMAYVANGQIEAIPWQA